MRVVIVVAALVACALPATAAAQAPPLSPERYAALENVIQRAAEYQAALAGDHADEAEALEQACLALSTTDVLLAGVRAACLASQRFTERSAVLSERLGRCRGGRCFATNSRKTAQEVDRLVRALRRADGRVRSEVPDAECSKVLLTDPAQLRWLPRFSRVLRALATAALGRSDRAFSRRLKELDRVVAAAPEGPTGEQLLEAFRRDCRAA